MDILKRTSVVFILLFLTSCFGDNVKEMDSQNFSYIEITDYPLNNENGKNAKLIFYKKGSDFKEKIKEYNDFSFNSYILKNTTGKVLNIKLNFDNSAPINSDMELIVDQTFYYRFKDISVKKDTLKKANILGNDLYIHKNIKAVINGKAMEFNEYKIHESKSIQLPFSLAKKL
ncbi:hypothetical protein [Chryseobacterium tongliaoense]|uniref:hypothetical protein n=1 Tax=Chryseobacterium tongliaoense TaxID=3240933 RepID=UPI00351842E5